MGLDASCDRSFLQQLKLTVEHTQYYMVSNNLESCIVLTPMASFRNGLNVPDTLVMTKEPVGQEERRVHN